jgi:hypothetical protein
LRVLKDGRKLIALEWQSMKKTGTSDEQRLSKGLLVMLAALAFLVTGCPHNDYTVQLTPRGPAIERTLTFFCADGTNRYNGGPHYQSFDPAELAAITALYPANGLTHGRGIYKARGEFTNAMPGDVGGTGTYTDLVTSLGEAGIYTERFRGNDDLVGMAERRSQAADQLTGLLIGWSEMELRNEAGYPQLRHFLDVDFRRDLKNASAYWAEGQFIEMYRTNATEEFIVRFGQYLWERNYFSVDEIPKLSNMIMTGDSRPFCAWLQRLAARKMGVSDTKAVPAPLAFLANDASIEKSFDRYLVTTQSYQSLLRQWQKDQNTNADLKQPEPRDVIDPIGRELIDFDPFQSPDHLTVRLSLPLPPIHGNGRWDGSLKQEIWESDIPGRTNGMRAPFFCFADWAQANDSFQVGHFGKIVLTGDQLTQYCLWRSALDQSSGREWDTFLLSLKPGAKLSRKIEEFRFTGESDQANQQQAPVGLSNFPRDLLGEALR